MSAGVIATNRLRRRDRLCSLSNNSTRRPNRDPARTVRVLATANAPPHRQRSPSPSVTVGEVESCPVGRARQRVAWISPCPRFTSLVPDSVRLLHL
jgi:hypothetical protein